MTSREDSMINMHFLRKPTLGPLKWVLTNYVNRHWQINPFARLQDAFVRYSIADRDGECLHWDSFWKQRGPSDQHKPQAMISYSWGWNWNKMHKLTRSGSTHLQKVAFALDNCTMPNRGAALDLFRWQLMKQHWSSTIFFTIAPARRTQSFRKRVWKQSRDMSQ